MEEGLGDPLSIAKDANLIRDAQSDIGSLDILVCGVCHHTFHFVEEFNSHKLNSCTELAVAKLCENEDNAQTWAFCLWKNKEINNEDNANENNSMWSIYQKWAKLSKESRDTWVIGGQTLLSLDKIRKAKMQEVKFKVKREEEKDPLALIDGDITGQDNKDDKNIILEGTKSSKGMEHINKDFKKIQEDEYNVEAILGKRFNPRRKYWEYKVKWENWDESQCSWEPIEHLTGCKALIHRFEEKLKQEKERKKILDTNKNKSILDTKIDDDSIDFKMGRRPQRSSKQKALSQVKRWLGDGGSDEENNKRFLEADDSDESFEKKMKLDEDTDDSLEDYDDKKKIQSKLSSSNGLGGKKMPHVLIPDAQGVVRINQKQLPSLSSGVYIMSKTAGIIKLDSQTSKIAANGGQAVVKVAPKIGQTHIRIVKKDGATTNKVIQMSPKSKLATSTPKVTQRITKVTKQFAHTPKVTVTTRVDPKFEEPPKSKSIKDEDEESDSGIPELEFPDEIIPPEPEEETQTDFVLDPTTGKIAGIEYPDPKPEPEITSEDNKENSESNIDNIVKLAAADITEADLKPDLSEPMETSNNDLELTINNPEILIEKKTEITPREEMIKIRKEAIASSKVQQKFVITPHFKNSNILERTLQTPRTVVKSPQGYTRHVHAAKSPQRILNSSMTPKLTSPMNPTIRTIVRSGHISKTKPRVYLPTPQSKFNDGIIKQQSHRSNINKRVGNIGNTTIYRKTPVRHSLAPKVSSRPSLNKKTSSTAIRTVVQKPPKPVISMPSLMDDDSPQATHETVQLKTDEETEVSNNALAVSSTPTYDDLSSFALNEEEAPIYITGDDGTVYQVAGQNEQGQTILITQGPDGQQQCLLVTSENATQEENLQELKQEVKKEGLMAEEGREVSNDQTETMEETQQNEEVQQDSQNLILSKTEHDTSDQVVAQVVRADPPSPGGTHKVVVMLPDGNLMVTQVSPEEYASLELDK